MRHYQLIIYFKLLSLRRKTAYLFIIAIKM